MRRAVIDAPTPAPAPAAAAPRSPAATIALVSVFVAGMWAAWSFTVDDAYITWRYSDNLSSGHGPVWNIGEDPVEGFTNFAWMLWHTPFIWLGVPPAVVAKVTSVALALAILVMLRRNGGLVAAAAFVLFVPTYFHTTGGLETVAFAAVLLRVVILGLRTIRDDEVRAWELPVLLLLSGTLRPEGAVAALPALLVWLQRNRHHRQAWLWTGGAAAAGAAYFLWRWTYYGHLLPNTFYVKFGNVDAGALWVTTTAAVVAPLAVLTLALLTTRSTRQEGLLLTATVATTYLTYAVSGPSMDYVHRFAFHAYPLLCLGAGVAVAAVGIRRLGQAAGVVTVVWVAVAGWRSPDLAAISNYGPDLQRAHVSIGQGLADAPVPSHARTLAVSDAGAIPYYSQWDTVDYIGLNNEAIAHGADPTDVIQAAEPTVVVVTHHSPEHRRGGYGVDLTQVTAGYELLSSVRMRDNYYQLVYAAPEWADAIRGPLQRAVDSAKAEHDPGRYDVTIDRWADRLRSQVPGV